MQIYAYPSIHDVTWLPINNILFRSTREFPRMLLATRQRSSTTNWLHDGSRRYQTNVCRHIHISAWRLVRDYSRPPATNKHRSVYHIAKVQLGLPSREMNTAAYGRSLNGTILQQFFSFYTAWFTYMPTLVPQVSLIPISERERKPRNIYT